VKLFRCQQRKAVFQVESHLMAEDTGCARTGTIFLMNAFCQYTVEQIKILFHSIFLLNGTKVLFISVFPGVIVEFFHQKAPGYFFYCLELNFQ